MDEAGALDGVFGPHAHEVVAVLGVGVAVELLEPLGAFEVDAAHRGRGDEAEQVEEEHLPLVYVVGFDAVEFGREDRADGMVLEAGQREGADRGPVEDLDGPGGGGLAVALEGGDLVAEVGPFPRLGLTCGLLDFDEVGGGFGDDGVPGVGEEPRDGGLAGTGCPGEEVAADQGLLR